MAEGKKVGFFNNYAAASNYIFYTGDSAVHLSTPGYRYCQYDLWDEEIFASGEPVFSVQSRHMNPPNLTRMVTGELKGHIIIQKFQPLTGLEIINCTYKQHQGNWMFEVTLHNNRKTEIITNHVSEPVLALMQNNIEVITVPLVSSGTDIILPQEQAILRFELNNAILESDTPFVLYTRTKENIRGELIAIQPE